MGSKQTTATKDTFAAIPPRPVGSSRVMQYSVALPVEPASGPDPSIELVLPDRPLTEDELIESLIDAALARGETNIIIEICSE